MMATVRHARREGQSSSFGLLLFGTNAHTIATL